MMNVSKFITTCCAVLVLFAWTADTARGQFLQTWIDIGDLQSQYSEIGYTPETLFSAEWPAILRFSNQHRGQAHWIGAKNFTDETGTNYDYYVAKTGPRSGVDGSAWFTPLETRLVSKWEDTEVFVDGVASFNKIAVVDEVDPNLPADRMLYHKWRADLGLDIERRVWAFSNEFHDDYHLIERVYTNTGNTDEDEEIELDGQTLNELVIFNAHRWRGREQAARHGQSAQTWGKYSMVDVVGDGHAEYPVDFTAIYLWMGYDPIFASTNWDQLGAPMIQALTYNAPSDTFGRLSGTSMIGRVVIHADASPSDESYDQGAQPVTLGYLDSDDILTTGSPSDEDHYELGMLTYENPRFFAGGSSRMFPHYADRVEPTGEFWNPTQDASTGKQGGHGATVAYGPYTMAFGEDVRIVEADVSAGLSYDAATQIGRAWNLGGRDSRNLLIDYDANGDGVINETPFDYDTYLNGSERLTKNQWVMTERDSLWSKMQLAIDVWNASGDMSAYPIPVPPAPPKTFEVFGRPNKVDLSWTTITGENDPVEWEIYRTVNYVDNLPYEKIATVSGSARSYEDTDLSRGLDYYYFIQAVGQPQSDDPTAMTGTPGGVALRSSRYYTQTYAPVNLKRPAGESISDFRIVPNPVNLAGDESVRFYVQGDRTRSQVAFFDIPGDCNIYIYTEIGEFVKLIEHRDGSGDELWNLTTDARQPLVSGVYLVRVVDNVTGDADVKKLVVIQ